MDKNPYPIPSRPKRIGKAVAGLQSQRKQVGGKARKSQRSMATGAAVAEMQRRRNRLSSMAAGVATGAAAGAFKFKPSGGANASEHRKPNTSGTPRRTLEYRPNRDGGAKRPLGPARPAYKKSIKPLAYKKPDAKKRTVYGLRDIYSGMRYKKSR